jgi:hypothetical protein
MGLFNLKDSRNHPRRSAFDLSSKVAFSAKSGERLPIKWYFTMPGDKFTLKRQHFTRTQPVNTSAYTRIREYYDWFWVPLLDYVPSAPDPQYFVAQYTDLPIPELDSIGMQSIPISMYSNSDSELSVGFASSY